MSGFLFRCRAWAALLLGGMTMAAANPPAAWADPCGMVPPVQVADADNLPIKRVGPQKTYVFFKNGLETFIIRPGYEGRVDEFGMLIPFPVPPAIRKAPDNVFEQIANAIDPPEVVVDLNPRFGALGGGFGGGGAGGIGGGGLGFAPPAKDEVKVVREEAVGMYEVAVLAAGSAKALKTWLDDHKYNYPSGMDLACEEYVTKRWCFVAVKTRIAAKEQADAQPAQRDVDADLPEGSVFDGHVQAMEFRFPSRELVVPMRLSAFNEGETRNVVYLLADKPAKIRNIPEEYVMRQMSGKELYKNLTEPLPVRILGGRAKDIPAWRRRTLAAERNPAPHNGVAADIFAGDLLAAKSGVLLSEHEVKEKELLAIGEELDLRGAAFDAAIQRQIAKERELAKKAVLHHLKDMALTIVDGEFPREVLAKDNLRFAEYTMDLRKSDPEFYDAKLLGPAGKQPGVLHTGAMDWSRFGRETQIAQADSSATLIGQLPSRRTASLFLFVGAAGLVVVAAARRQDRRVLLLLVVALTLIGLVLQPAVAFGEEEAKDEAVDEKEKEASITLSEAQVAVLLRQLEDSSSAKAAIDQLEKIGEPVAPKLVTIAKRDRNLARRGWAIVALGRIGGDDSYECLQWLRNNKKQPEMVRLWATAAQIKAASTPEQLDAVAQLAKADRSLERPMVKNIERQLRAGKIDLDRVAKLTGDFPSLEKLLVAHLERQLRAENADLSLVGLLQLCIRSPQYERLLAGPIVSEGGEALVKQMLTHEDQAIRRKAAGFTGTAAQVDKRVAHYIATALAMQPKAEQVPWHDGPLFIPGISWSKHPAEARQLAGNLIAWHVWCDTHKLTAEQRKINVNLGSVALSGAAGYDNLGQGGVSSEQWVAAWRKAAGEEATGKMLAQQGLALRDGKLVAQ